MTKVSIIIPAYNSEKWVSEAIESALKQTYKNIEIIVVNDGSTDKTEKEILKFGNKVKYIKQKNQGLSGARNTGIKEASSEIVVTLDSDDKLDLGFVEKLMPFTKKFDFISTWIHTFGDIDQIWHFGPYDGEKLFLKKIFFCGCGLFKKSMWKKIGGYKKIATKDGIQGFEDSEFWTSAWELGFKGYVLPEPLYFYRKHGYSMNDDANNNTKELEEVIKSLHPELYKKYGK